MRKLETRLLVTALVLAFASTSFIAHVHASSLGIGTNEATLPSTGLFAPVLNWVNVQQQSFYRALTGALKAMRQEGSKLWLLIGLSFVYGVFHAAGPGHGKAVISSYMVANEVALRRGIMLSFVSAFLQAATAIALMTLVFLVLRGTAVSMTDATWFLEVTSYAAVTAFGAWLLWRKSAPLLRRMAGVAPAQSLSAAHSHAHSHGRDGHSHAFHDHSAHDHSHGPGEVCSTCGHAHAPDPGLLSDNHFDWRTAWSAVAAVGIRPCSGALIVLSFAFLNGLWVGGVLSVLAMAVGTAITVSILATLAVTAKNWAVLFAGDGRVGNYVHAAFEIGGAALVFLLGLLLLSASLAA